MAKRKKHQRSGARDNADDQASSYSRAQPRLGGKGGNLWLYGVHACLAALANPDRQIRRIVIAVQSSEDLDFPVADAIQGVKDEHPEVIRPSAEYRDRREMEALLPRDAVHQGICMEVGNLSHPIIEDIIDDSKGLESACIVVLDQASDPRNIGAVMRTAAALGALAVVVQDKHAPDITGSMAKAASGAMERLPYVKVTNLARTLGLLKAGEFWCVGFAGQATDYLSPKTLKGRSVIVLGSEGAGLRRLTLETCDLLVKIPMTEAVESLNLSNAAAIALYQFAQSNA